MKKLNINSMFWIGFHINLIEYLLMQIKLVKNLYIFKNIHKIKP